MPTSAFDFWWRRRLCLSLNRWRRRWALVEGAAATASSDLERATLDASVEPGTMEVARSADDVSSILIVLFLV